MAWSFSGGEWDRGSDYTYHTRPKDREEGFVNYLHLGKERFQLTPTEIDYRIWSDDDTQVPGYRGHTFQLWNDDGTPTPYFLNYHHDHEHRSHDMGSVQEAVKRAMEQGAAYLVPPTSAPDPLFVRYYPNTAVYSEGMVYGQGPFDAATSRGNSTYQQLDRDMHYYTINRPAEYKYGLEESMIEGSMVNKYQFADRADNVQMTPRPEAQDPVQNLVLRGDNPKSRLIMSGESNLAQMVESRATVPAAPVKASA